jgi:hypothetical protein
MSVSRRRFVTDASTFGMIAALLPELVSAQEADHAAAAQASSEDAPHSSYGFWHGFFDAVNPTMNVDGKPAKPRGPADQLPDPAAETQYLHYKFDESRLRYATDIGKEELLKHDGDVAISVALSQYRPGNGETHMRASQLRVDTTQIHPLMNIFAPIAWTSIASLTPSKSTGKIPPLDQLGFHSPQATQGTNKILLTQGAGMMAVNISKASESSLFVKALNVIMNSAKMVVPLVSLPAISVPALSAFTQVLADWENRTKFLLNGNLTTAIATKSALEDNELPARHIGLISGDYLMIPQRHVADIADQLPSLRLDGGYLVHRDADAKMPLQSRAEITLPGVTYATMRLSVKPLDGCWVGRPAA